MQGVGYEYTSTPLTLDDLERQIREAKDQARDDAHEAGVNEYLTSLLGDLNARDAKEIRKVLDRIKSDIENEIEGTVDTIFGGSISKHTYVNGISDVDALVLLDKSELAEKTPNEVKSFLADCLRDRYGTDAVGVGELAVTLTLEEKEVQLLPALRHQQGFKIADSDGRNWAKVNPRRFAKALTNANERLGGKLVPCVKLIKAVIAKLSESEQISGYHVESMAINVFKGYDAPMTPKSMLHHFFDKALAHVLKPIKDSSGQSVHVDEYLGAENSSERQTVARSFIRTRLEIDKADGAGSLEAWKELFE